MKPPWGYKIWFYKCSFRGPQKPREWSWKKGSWSPKMKRSRRCKISCHRDRDKNENNHLWICLKDSRLNVYSWGTHVSTGSIHCHVSLHKTLCLVLRITKLYWGDIYANKEKLDSVRFRFSIFTTSGWCYSLISYCFCF